MTASSMPLSKRRHCRISTTPLTHGYSSSGYSRSSSYSQRALSKCSIFVRSSEIRKSSDLYFSIEGGERREGGIIKTMKIGSLLGLLSLIGIGSCVLMDFTFLLRARRTMCFEEYIS